MADPLGATITQLKNIQSRTGRTVPDLLAALAQAGLGKHGERRSWLMSTFALGYGDANTLAHFVDKPLPDLVEGSALAAAPALAVAAGDPLDALYSGARSGLRPLHEAVMQALRAFGPFEEAPKKSYMSLRRRKQFAMVGPATKDSVEIGLNAKDLPAHPRLKVQPPGGMCQATTRLQRPEEVDAELIAWLRQAYDAAG